MHFPLRYKLASTALTKMHSRPDAGCPQSVSFHPVDVVSTVTNVLESETEDKRF